MSNALAKIADLEQKLRAAGIREDDLEKRVHAQRESLAQRIAEVKMLTAAIVRLKAEAAKDVEAMERKDRVIVAVKAWQEWFTFGHNAGLREAKNPTGDLLRAFDTYVEWCYPGITLGGGHDLAKSMRPKRKKR